MDTSQIVLSKPEGYKNISTSKTIPPKEIGYIECIKKYIYSFF